jgi:hypothetical protein
MPCGQGVYFVILFEVPIWHLKKLMAFFANNASEVTNCDRLLFFRLDITICDTLMIFTRYDQFPKIFDLFLGNIHFNKLSILVNKLTVFCRIWSVY